MLKRISIGFLVLLVNMQLGISAKAQSQVPPTPTISTKSICPNQLGAIIDAVINRPQFNRMRWGILVQNLGFAQTLYSRDAEKYFVPASVNKLLITAAVLQQLGKNFRFRTSVYSSGDGVLHVVGRGDPSLTDIQLIALAKQLQQKGIREVKSLIVDDGYFQGELVNPSWQWEDIQSDYGAPINSLILNQNIFSLKLLPQIVGQPLQIVWSDRNEAKYWKIVNQSITTGEDQLNDINITRDLTRPILKIQGNLAVNSQPESISLPVFAPAEYFLEHFRNALATQNIKVRQAYVSSTNSSLQQELAAVESPPLPELLAQMNLNSYNLFAEALLRSIGASSLQQAQRTQPTIKKPTDKNKTSADAGLDVMKATLTRLGVDPGGYILADASGLSRKNLVSPQALVQTLQAMAKSQEAYAYRASLPVAGKSGTLKSRYLHTQGEGIVQAKTGSMDGVVSLAGYITPPNYQPLAFSIIVNQSNQPIKVVRRAIDDVVVSLAQLQRCQ
ncbi:D-alanyl-D-alanine carboxypeptidase/D-alanyl-D-alanine-endopeptidase [Aetokthonos hydrillicola Thurmond2011]|jgi:D-alanyl-D-alanine carboxypeptidase/D-alanyl-D-alanine-endopeptidase (penicillin-binding protein 4)|uniref:D-alanyl-D-alanine carboxypeptidase/D-alanyl-D-alanine-endopeptidase n=1 Tax=Aetokthonos hydrillicola Thurmond2011 TaxID=2712845 RepID=A0AAP5IBX5_9CYAN|nr:D-alanyl-D-alanine carboxypeptidase/D-alanyl-D-alanine-endopeptidase [Aetokthonos hydrillicola]MBO3459911.1 D-alanyl-D-alanine carboxypeptidase/D-alanyl-D-alanine-endopeptidase [Aetokthonos hydrillicola CCALA 1050]MBW4584028.1 D-alanyl-D-alanine carboxypeptidase/D-alanyl-D-alanine-endopeptidase [Aetokthonos hydrillicola CCALA 1050]MDR9898777.1 D-alanyl-D-alanine carboxypeptidase/D-alanyl-D-alanine-endopeptidase [Aetokthonos hydrillicola Thurmond2011]